MKPFVLALLAPLLVTPAPQSTTHLGHSRVEHSCDLRLNVVDPDPRGLNVRSGPGRTEKVIAVLEPVGEWVEVHVVGQAGDWLLIDRAEAVDDDAPEGMREVFRGGGWVHSRGLGISELLVGEGTVLRMAPAADADVVRRIARPEDEPKQTRVLGCRANYLEVDADGVRGFTTTYCTNERTTCS
jgi:hypothetical protein